MRSSFVFVAVITLSISSTWIALIFLILPVAFSPALNAVPVMIDCLNSTPSTLSSVPTESRNLSNLDV